jgi:hypothetical protein
MADVAVKACLNGGRSREEHAAVPLTAAELAADATPRAPRPWMRPLATAPSRRFEPRREVWPSGFRRPLRLILTRLHAPPR